MSYPASSGLLRQPVPQRRLDARFAQHSLNEAALGVGVSIAVAAMLAGEVRLQMRVVATQARIGPQDVSEREQRLSMQMIPLDHVQVMGSGLWLGPQEPQAVVAAWIFWPEQPALRPESPHSVVRRLQRSDRREHVNDRLRGQAGNRCRADVLNRACQPRAKHGGHPAPLFGEHARPRRVVLNDLHELIGHPPNLRAVPTLGAWVMLAAT